MCRAERKVCKSTVYRSKKINMLISQLALVAYNKIRLINSTVFACSSVVCPVFVTLL